MQVKISVIIPNYNGIKFLEDCVDSLMDQTFHSFEIILVDDCSEDGAMQALEKKYPDNGSFPRTHYLYHDTNCGFARSVNDGIEAASSEYVLLLNNDTKADRNFVGRMYKAISSHNDIFSISARMLSMSDPDIMDDAGDYYSALGWAFSPAKDKPASMYDKASYIFAACGGAAVYRKAALLALGGFDNRHFAYLEDIDLGYRARLYGWKNVYLPGAVVLHAGSGTSGSRHNKFKVTLSSRNNIYLIYKNMPDWQILLNLPFFIAGFGIKTLFFMVKGLGLTYLAGLLEGFRMCRKAGKSVRVDFKRIPAGRIWALEGELLLNILRRL